MALETRSGAGRVGALALGTRISADIARILDCIDQAVRAKVDTLDDDRARRVIYARFGLDGELRTLADLAREMDVPVETVRRIQGQALGKLARP